MLKHACDSKNDQDNDQVEIESTTEQENEEVLGEMEQPDLNTLPEEPNEPKKASNMSAKEELKLRPIVIADRATLRRSVRGLSYEQRLVFDDVIHYCRCVAIDNLGGQIDPEPPKYKVHGEFA